MSAAYSRISSISCWRPAFFMSRAMACAANRDDRATRICTADRGHSRFSSHCAASSERSRFAVVSLSRAAAARRSPEFLVDANVLVDALRHVIGLPLVSYHGCLPSRAGTEQDRWRAVFLATVSQAVPTCTLSVGLRAGRMTMSSRLWLT